MERLFRLHGIRYVEFVDLVNLMVKVPLKFIYKKRKLSSIGYASYEREVYEAFRIYRTLQNLDESIRHFMLDRLLRDRVRVFGYEKVSDFLSYQNQLKLILAGLVGTTAMEETDGPICINYTGMAEVIEKRYEAVKGAASFPWNSKTKSTWSARSPTCRPSTTLTNSRTISITA
ncbi:MAG: hypothetical protein JRH05_17640 [Deltaproteobacteria bacterium]|nr:hypothetical protein [Deltaproteobacteria bacterium]